MKISYNWLKDYIKKLPKAEKLGDLLTLQSLEIESIDRIGKDHVFDIEVLPNRAHDCLSHIGVAREISAITAIKLSSYQAIKPKENKKLRIQDFVNLKVENSELCPRYTARVMLGVKIGPSPKWMQERLEAVGARAINNVVDCTNYTMLELGQPLHAFDMDKLKSVEIQISTIRQRSGCPERSRGAKSKCQIKSKIQNPKFETKKIIVRRAQKSEKITTLDGEERELDQTMLVITDSQRPIAIAGVMGGASTEVDAKTQNLILESANFNSVNIRKTSKKLELQSESSLRFQAGLDPNLASEAIDCLAQLIQETSGGTIVNRIIDVYPKKVYPKKIKLNLDYVKKLLGVDISEKEIKDILQRLGLLYTLYPKPYTLTVTIPTFRQDLEIQEDLIEEIGRIYGYDKVKATPPEVRLGVPQEAPLLSWQNLVKDVLVGLRFNEVYNYSFVGEKQLHLFDIFDKKYIEVKNPTSSDYKYLRKTLIINLLKNIQYNSRYFNRIKLFELGKIYSPSPDTFAVCRKSEWQGKPSKASAKEGGKVSESKLLEKSMLTLVFWDGSGDSKKHLEFYQLKGEVDFLLDKMGVSEHWYDEFEPTPEDSSVKIWHPKRKAEIKIDNREIGFLGEINPNILEGLGIKERVAVADLDFEKLVNFASADEFYHPITRYPASVRDIAVLVDRGTLTEEVLNIINRVGGELVRDVDLFDMYEGEELPDGKKNLAFHIIYQAEDRTLRSDEVDNIHSKIIEALEKEMGWEVRR